MLRRLCGVMVALLILCTAATAMAQSAPSGRWWRSARVVKALNLTNNETQRLENAYRQSRRELIKKKSRVESEQFELQNLMDQPNIDEKAIRAQNRKLEKARSDLADEKFAFVIQVRKIIGHERFQRLVRLHGGSN